MAQQNFAQRLMVALAVGMLGWRVLLQLLYFTGSVAAPDLAVVTAAAAGFTVLAFKGPGLPALVALAAGVLSWRLLLQVLIITGGAATTELAAITALAVLVAGLVFHRAWRSRATTAY